MFRKENFIRIINELKQEVIKWVAFMVIAIGIFALIVLLDTDLEQGQNSQVHKVQE